MADVPRGIELDGLQRFFAASVPGGDVTLEVRLLSGGRSNLTYLVTGGGREWVLRRPPLGHLLPTAHDMSREFRVLSGMAKTNVPAPRPYALCEDPAGIGASFYVMDYRAGAIVSEEWPAGIAETVEDQRALSLSMVDVLARIHAVDPAAVGLADFGRPEGYVARQLKRWGEQWERSKTRDLPTVYELHRRLTAAIPESPGSAIVHGDYRLGNIVIKADHSVEAILDWEMATLGDPLTDLGWLLLYWDSPEDMLAASFRDRPGGLTRAEVVEEYGRRSGRVVENAEFYLAFALFKNAVIIEGIFARYLRGETVGEGFDRYNGADILIGRGLAVCDASIDRRLRGEA